MPSTVLTNDDKDHCLIVALLPHMTLEILDNTGSGDGLLPDGTRPLPEPMLTNHKRGLVSFT